jgi:hypothetical protein
LATPLGCLLTLQICCCLFCYQWLLSISKALTSASVSSCCLKPHVKRTHGMFSIAVGATVVCFTYSILFLKLWSYVQVNLWCRNKCRFARSSASKRLRRQSISFGRSIQKYLNQLTLLFYVYIDYLNLRYFYNRTIDGELYVLAKHHKMCKFVNWSRQSNIIFCSRTLVMLQKSKPNNQTYTCRESQAPNY